MPDGGQRELQRASASAPASSAAGAGPGGGAPRRVREEAGECGQAGVPGFIFKAVALIREDLIACEWGPSAENLTLNWRSLNNASYAHHSEGAPPHQPTSLLLLPAPAGQEASPCNAAWPASPAAACPAGHNLVAGVIDPSQAEDGMLVAAGVSSELDALKATYLDLPEFLTSVVESELARVPRALARAAESRLWSILYMPQARWARRRA